MTTEEKAKAYDEALKVIKKCNPDENGFITIYPQEIFSELKESEDERIRKGIIKFLIDVNNGAYSKSELEIASWINWLGKQAPKNKTALDKAIEEEVNAWFEKQREKPKPKWTREDEENYKDIIGAIHAVAYQPFEDEVARLNWLKSLKKRMEE